MSDESNRQVIFVCGPPRSGTTMLSNMLSQGAAIPFLPECSILTAIISHRLNLEIDQHPLKFRAFLQDQNVADEHYRRLVDAIIAGLFERAAVDATRAVLKDPYLVYRYDVLHRFTSYPIRTVCIVRDPRDVVASLTRVFAIQEGDRSFDRALAMSLSFYEAIATAIEHRIDANPLKLVKYESIVQRDQRVVQSLSDFVNYDFALDNPSALGPDQIDFASPWYSANYGQPITAEPVGTFSTSMSPAEIAAVEAAFVPFAGIFDGEHFDE